MNRITSLLDRYFRPGDSEPILYRRLGVRCFKRYLPTGGDIYAERMKWHPILDRTGGLAAALLRVERRTRLAESAHLLAFIFFATVSVVGLVAGGRIVPIILISTFNVGFNIYPIMVQRYNRHRILRLLQRLNDAAGDGESSRLG